MGDGDEEGLIEFFDPGPEGGDTPRHAYILDARGGATGDRVRVRVVPLGPDFQL